MVVIRLSRVGKKKQAFYRIVVADSRRPVTAKVIEILGWYNPHSKEININKEKIETWFSNGAKPSNSVAILLNKNGIKLPDKVKITQKNKKPKNAPITPQPDKDIITENNQEVIKKIEENSIDTEKTDEIKTADDKN